MNGMLFSLLFSQLHPGMHGRGPKASAPASEAAGRGRDAADRASVPRRTASCHVASPESGRRGPTRLKSAPIRRKSDPMRPKSGRLGPYRPYRPVSAETAETAESGRNSKKKKKKKKKVQPPDPSHFVQPLSLRPSSPLQKNPGKSRVHNYISLWKIP